MTSLFESSFEKYNHLIKQHFDCAICDDSLIDEIPCLFCIIDFETRKVEITNFSISSLGDEIKDVSLKDFHSEGFVRSWFEQKMREEKNVYSYFIFNSSGKISKMVQYYLNLNGGVL